jgi:hypothetical protein
MPWRPAPGPFATSVWRYIRRAPGTFIWLTILFATTLIIRHVSPHFAHHILVRQSTNIKYLHKSPVRVLITSALWIAGSGWFVYFLLYNVFHVPAERWLGTARWLLVVAAAHIGATLLSQRAVFFDIRDARLPHSLAHTIDIGVSYGIAGILGVLAYRVPWPWRWGYLAIVLGFFTYPVLSDGSTFSDLGHLAAVLIGLCCYALTPEERTADAAPPRSRLRHWTR